jgi:hypothetical protein
MNWKNSGGGTKERIEALRKREQALKAAIAAEQIRLARSRERVQERLVRIIGSCLLSDLEANPSLLSLLQESLKRFANPRDVEFLRAQGWDV